MGQPLREAFPLSSPVSHLGLYLQSLRSLCLDQIETELSDAKRSVLREVSMFFVSLSSS